MGCQSVQSKLEIQKHGVLYLSSERLRCLTPAAKPVWAKVWPVLPTPRLYQPASTSSRREANDKTWQCFFDDLFPTSC
jgi:hypothetical protein